MSKLDSLTETQVVAMIARKDPYEVIIAHLNDRGIEITKGAISGIKKRNSEALAYMQGAMAEKSLSHATVILQKSRQLLERKLDNSLSLQENLDNLDKDYKDGLIDEVQYHHLRESAYRADLSAAELNAITKESFNQSQVEQGKPSSITENPAQAKENLQRLLIAIKQGDDQAALAAIFPHA